MKTIFILTLISFLMACSSPEKIDRVTDASPHRANPDVQVVKNPVIPETRPKKDPFAATLAAHNKVRQSHGLSPLIWSDKLASYSQEWANHLSQGSQCQMYHRSGTPPFGENLYRSSALVWSNGKREIAPVSIENVVKAWADEEKWYNYQRNICLSGKQCGHYTQIVWQSTTEVGCAMSVCADKSQTWVCSYNPPGNYLGVRPY